MAPSRLDRSRTRTTHSVWGAQNLLAGLMDRDFGALWELLGALLTASLAQIFFQDVFVLLFEPFGVDFELPR